jgi:hypothetical protein
MIGFINCPTGSIRLKLLDMELTGIGLYTLQQASRISGAKSSEVSRWLFGYNAGENKRIPPLWQTQIGRRGEGHRISRLDGIAYC